MAFPYLRISKLLPSSKGVRQQPHLVFRKDPSTDPVYHHATFPPRKARAQPLQAGSQRAIKKERCCYRAVFAGRRSGKRGRRRGKLTARARGAGGLYTRSHRTAPSFLLRWGAGILCGEERAGCAARVSACVTSSVLLGRSNSRPGGRGL